DDREGQREQDARQQQPSAGSLQQFLLGPGLRQRAAGRGLVMPRTAGILVGAERWLHRAASGLALTKAAPPGRRTGGRAGLAGAVASGALAIVGPPASAERNGT